MTQLKNEPTPSVESTARSRLSSLTGLRFVAALLVFLSHTGVSYPPAPGFGKVNPFSNAGLAHNYEWFLSNLGNLGVSFFFVLSGFVLTWATPTNERSRSFIRRRLVKIFPNHVATWAVSMVLFAGAITPIAQWLPNLLLLHGFSPDPAAWISVNPVSWSLSSEMFFYLLFPLLIRPIRRIADNRLRLWAAATVIGMLLLVLFNQFLVPSLFPDNANANLASHVTGPQFWIGYFFPLSRLFEFVLGMLLARLILTRRAPRVGLLPASVLTAVCYVVTLFVPQVYAFNLVTIVPVALLICAAASSDMRGTRGMLQSRAAQWLGEISFAFYLCQALVALYAKPLLLGDDTYSTPVAILVILGMLVANILAARLLFVGLERPAMRRWGRQVMAKPTKAEVARAA